MSDSAEIRQAGERLNAERVVHGRQLRLVGPGVEAEGVVRARDPSQMLRDGAADSAHEIAVGLGRGPSSAVARGPLAAQQ